MDDCISLKVGDKCDRCTEGVMRSTGKASTKEELSSAGKNRPTQRSEEIQCDNPDCGHTHVNLDVFLYTASSLGLKSRSDEKVNRKPVREVDHKVKTTGYQLRTVIARSENGTIVGQIGWDGRNLNHVHCKLCDNEWTEAKGIASDTKFECSEIIGGRLHFKCKNCQREFDSGS